MIGTTGIAIIDAVICGVALILAIIGLVKGFTNQLFALFGTLAVIVGAVLLSTLFAGWLQPMFGESIQKPITDWMIGLDAGEGTIKIFTEPLDWTNRQYVDIALVGLGLPSFVSGLVGGAVADVFAGFGTAKLAEKLPPVLTEWALTAIAFIILVIILGIVLVCVKKLFKSAAKLPVINGFDKMLGFAFGIGQAYLIFSIAFMLLSFIPSSFLPSVQGTINEQIQLSVIAKALSANNWIGAWIITLLS